MHHNFTALGVDIFAGLFTYGIQQAGFKVLGQLEHTDYGAKTCKLNFPDLDQRLFIQNWNARDFRRKVDFLYSNPPCAAWSSNRGGSSESWMEHSDRLQIVRDIVDLAEVIEPKAWAWESVTNAWLHGRAFVLEQAERLVQLGYHVTILLQNNKYIGGTQNRKRVFVIAHKHPLVWPAFTTPPTVRQLLKSARKVRGGPEARAIPRSLAEAWQHADQFSGKLRRSMEALYPDGDSPSPRPAFAATRLRLDEAPGVFMGGENTYHPTDCRYVTWGEALALTGLPMTWQTANRGQSASGLELSRAVLPGVGAWLGRAVAAGLRLPALRSKRTIRLVDLQDPEHPREELLWTLGDAPTPRPDYAAALAAKALRQPAPSVAKPLRSASPRKPGSGARIREMLLKGNPAAKILDVIYAEFPTSKATAADVSYHRGKLRKEGLL